jgi:glycosyltransferase involved in cell wall biosynthesis
VTSGLSAARADRYVRAATRWGRLLLTPASHHREPGIRVFYGHDRIPALGTAVSGGSAKIQRLGARFPNHPIGFSIVYLGSNWIPRDLAALLRLVRRRDVPLVVNQDGVGYPGWAGGKTEEVNRPLRSLLAAADHVLYQSDFCKRSADEWIGTPRGSWEVLPNAVDVDAFAPADVAPKQAPVLLLGGDQSQEYRLELAVATLAALVPEHPDVELIVTGRLAAPLEPLVERYGVSGRVHAVGPYTQRVAPEMYRRAHVLLHTKVNDPCPNVVLEALASGLPVVYPRSGGVPELVGDDAGVGVPHPDGYERDDPPSAEALATAITHVLANLRSYSAAARTRAVERFALGPWLDRHAEIFELLSPK